MKFYDPKKDLNTISHPVSAMAKNAVMKKRFAPNMKIENGEEELTEIDLVNVPGSTKTTDQNGTRSHTHRI
jgi:hypothetical protein